MTNGAFGRDQEARFYNLPQGRDAGLAAAILGFGWENDGCGRAGMGARETLKLFIQIVPLHYYAGCVLCPR